MTGKESLRYVNGMPLSVTNALITHPETCATLKRVCEWRRDTPGELAELMTEAGIVAMDDSAAQTMKRLLLTDWTPLQTLMAAINKSAVETQSTLTNAIRRTDYKLERRGLKGAAEYRMVAA